MRKRLSDEKKSRTPSWQFLIVIVVEPATLKESLLLQTDGCQKRCTLQFDLFLLSHSAYITFRIIMSFRKPCHMPFSKLILPFTLTVTTHILIRKQKVPASGDLHNNSARTPVTSLQNHMVIVTFSSFVGDFGKLSLSVLFVCLFVCFFQSQPSFGG